MFIVIRSGFLNPSSFYVDPKIVFLENNFNKFVASIMPDTVSKNGKIYTIPEKWKI